MNWTTAASAEAPAPKAAATPARTDEIRPRREEMRSARRVQARLLRGKAPGLDTLDCAGSCLPDRAVGGDFYDFLQPGPGRLVLIVGDVSGKGVPAGLMMAALQASLRSHYALAAGDLGQRLESVNRLFFECTAKEHYASLFVGEYDDASRRLRYANCGHVPPLLARSDRTVTRVRATATVLGLFETWNAGIDEVTLEPGDTLVLATDGIVEAAGPAGEEFGELRLASAVKRLRELPAPSLLEAIAGEVRRFSGGVSVDDQTLVVARARAALGGSRQAGVQ